MLIYRNAEGEHVNDVWIWKFCNQIGSEIFS